MRLFFKLLRLTLLLALLAASLATAVLWFEGKDLVRHYKSDIELALSEALGVSVTAADLQVSLYPRLGFRAQDVEVRTSEYHKPWKAAELDLAADLEALLRGRINIHSIEVQGLEGTLIATSNREVAPAAARSSPKRRITINLQELIVRTSRLTITHGESEWPLVLSDARGALSTASGSLIVPNATLKGSVRGVPLTAELSDFALMRGEASVRTLNLLIEKERLNVSAAYGPENRLSGKISLTNLNLSSFLGAIGRMAGWRFGKISGTLSGSVSLSGRAETPGIEFNLLGRRLEAHLSRAKLLDLSGGIILGADYKMRTGKLASSFEDLLIKTDPRSYSADSGDIEATFKAEEGWSANGRMTAKNFSYRDAATEVRQVNAEASRIAAAINRKGDLTIAMQVDGSSLALTAPSVEVTSVRKISSPLRISVPAAGGYEISGPVSAEGGMLTVEGRKLEDLSGTVRMLISRPLLDFKSEGLTARSSGQKVNALGAFAMMMDRFQLDLSPLTLAGGSVSGSWSVSRGGNTEAKLELSASTLDLPQAFQAIMQRPGQVDGSLESLSLSIKGDRTRFLQSASGRGTFVLLGSPPDTLNLRDKMLAAVAALPGAGDLLGAKEALDRSRDRRTAADFRITKGKLYLENIKAKRTGYFLEGDASISLDQALEGQFSAIFFKDTLKGLGLGIKPLQALFSRATRISIPLDVQGTVEDPRVSINYAKLARSAPGLGIAESVAGGIWDSGKRVIGVFRNNGGDPAQVGPSGPGK